MQSGGLRRRGNEKTASMGGLWSWVSNTPPQRVGHQEVFANMRSH